MYFCTGFADALGEGMTAVISKMEIRLSDMKAEEEKKKIFMDDVEKRSVGNYFMIRMAMRALGTVIGGFLAKSTSIKYVYAIFCIFPLFMVIWSSVYFKEIEVSDFNLILT